MMLFLKDDLVIYSCKFDVWIWIEFYQWTCSRDIYSSFSRKTMISPKKIHEIHGPGNIFPLELMIKWLAWKIVKTYDNKLLKLHLRNNYRYHRYLKNKIYCEFSRKWYENIFIGSLPKFGLKLKLKTSSIYSHQIWSRTILISVSLKNC